MVSSAVISRGGACALTAPVLAAALICAMPAAAQETPPPAQDAAAEQNVTLEIQAYDIQGNTLLDALAVETAVYPYLGPDRTPADVEKAREALEKAYHAKGYQSVVVDVPQQRADSGVVKLAVTEAPIGRVRVEGSRYFSPEVIKRQTAALVPGQTPNLTMAQAQITDLNRNPDRRVTPLLKAGKVPGTVDVELKVSDTLPLHASLELNNDHAAGTSDLRLSGTVRYTNLW
ncbi:MAG: POTRA domain-containing protein, partial [Caulobacteraceae bacterium]